MSIELLQNALRVDMYCVLSCYAMTLPASACIPYTPRKMLLEEVLKNPLTTSIPGFTPQWGSQRSPVTMSHDQDDEESHSGAGDATLRRGVPPGFGDNGGNGNSSNSYFHQPLPSSNHDMAPAIRSLPPTTTGGPGVVRKRYVNRRNLNGTNYNSGGGFDAGGRCVGGDDGPPREDMHRGCTSCNQCYGRDGGNTCNNQLYARVRGNLDHVGKGGNVCTDGLMAPPSLLQPQRPLKGIRMRHTKTNRTICRDNRGQYFSGRASDGQGSIAMNSWGGGNMTMVGMSHHADLSQSGSVNVYGGHTGRAGVGRRAGDWDCRLCGNLNFSFRIDQCGRCHAPKPGINRGGERQSHCSDDARMPSPPLGTSNNARSGAAIDSDGDGESDSGRHNEKLDEVETAIAGPCEVQEVGGTSSETPRQGCRWSQLVGLAGKGLDCVRLLMEIAMPPVERALRNVLAAAAKCVRAFIYTSMAGPTEDDTETHGHGKRSKQT